MAQSLIAFRAPSPVFPVHASDCSPPSRAHALLCKQAAKMPSEAQLQTCKAGILHGNRFGQRRGGKWRNLSPGPVSEDPRSPNALSEASADEHGDQLGETSEISVVAEASSSRSSQMQVLIAAALTILLGVANRVLYKMALVPLKSFPFFLAQFTTFGYVVVYLIILWLRYQSGIVTTEMLSLPKWPFAAIGTFDALGLAAGMAAAAVLPGALIPILTQAFLIWQLALSYVLLGKRYPLQQIAGCILVILGVVTVVVSGGGASVGAEADISSTGLFWLLLMVFSTSFNAASSILKEFVFKDAAKKLEGKTVDIFVVNSFGSTFQALAVLLLLPFLSSLRGIPFPELPQYFKDGATCFFNIGTGTIAGCEGAPLLPVLYVSFNLAFNIAALYLLKSSSAIVTSLALTLSVPLTSAAFTLPLPYLGTPAHLSSGYFIGSLVLIVGLVLYNVAGAASKPKAE
eukprot:TRINITY_DN1804_c0_g1_i1.p1 TRINITY_DN1804_c0_g1~~TRINITY_DN1804_c0_g1_i1.p1  ORF type:complete len:459 (+),score=100.20 TRINITY_DN1804_c0_g1_i1:118-1494(+)